MVEECMKRRNNGLLSHYKIESNTPLLVQLVCCLSDYNLDVLVPALIQFDLSDMELGSVRPSNKASSRASYWPRFGRGCLRQW